MRDSAVGGTIGALSTKNLPQKLWFHLPEG